MVSAIVMLTVLLSARPSMQPATQLSDRDLERRFNEVVRPFAETYCVSCHGGERAAAQFDLRAYSTMAAAVRDHAHWALVSEKLSAMQMPPASARQPPAEQRQRVIDWIAEMRRSEAKKSAGDPGVVLARRLSNAEYNYTIRDLTGVDLRPAREFPVDPANPFGFDNSGESLSMSPNLFSKYLQAAREVANAVVLKPQGIAFAPHPMLVETDHDRYAVNQIIDFYKRQNTDLSDYFQAAWHFKHRVALGAPKAALGDIAAARTVSAKYLATVWRALEQTKETMGPLATLQSMWRDMPGASDAARVKPAADRMRDYIVQLRKKIEFQYTPIQVKGLGETSQPFLMWRNKQYAANRTSFNRSALQEDHADPELRVPTGAREQYEAAFARFAAIFPDAFYVSERGRYFPDNTRDTGRHLSAGFHNVMGYFRDDTPLYDLILAEAEQRQLDAMWRELDFVALGLTRTFIQFFLNESGEARGLRREAEGPRPADKEITSEAVVLELAEAYRNRVRQANHPIALKAIDEHFAWVNRELRWVENAKREAEPTHVTALIEFAARAWRRPLTAQERSELASYYRSLRDKDKLTHDDAIRDAIVMVLMSPDFCYRIDLVAGNQPTTMQPLSDVALASRLSYFLWSSMPDEELMAVAIKGALKQPEVLLRQARRMLKDNKIRGLASEFGGNWLDFRRFEEINTIDRERFPVFDHALRQAMFEEPIQFMLDVFRENRSVLDFLYAKHTFVNDVLAKHYEIPMAGLKSRRDESRHDTAWSRVDNADEYGRGGLLPMAVFLTKNAPGLRTSPVKRGYWMVKQVLGEHIPPPPAQVPELPRDEAKLDLPLRDLLARHREDQSCASCHSRFDALGLVFEGYGPVGERRERDLSGRSVDASATFPGGRTGSGVEGLRDYVRAQRQDDFIDNLSRKLLAFALGRSLQLSDEPTIDTMRAKLARDGYRFDSLIESIVTSTQFRNKRGTS